MLRAASRGRRIAGVWARREAAELEDLDACEWEPLGVRMGAGTQGASESVVFLVKEKGRGRTVMYLSMEADANIWSLFQST